MLWRTNNEDHRKACLMFIASISPSEEIALHIWSYWEISFHSSTQDDQIKKKKSDKLIIQAESKTKKLASSMDIIDFFNIAYLRWYQEYHNNNHSDILESYCIALFDAQITGNGLFWQNCLSRQTRNKMTTQQILSKVCRSENMICIP